MRFNILPWDFSRVYSIWEQGLMGALIPVFLIIIAVLRISGLLLSEGSAYMVWFFMRVLIN